MIWLLVAHPREIHGLQDLVKERGSMKLIFTGIGLLDSMAKVAMELARAEQKPSAMIQLGTAGFLDSGGLFDCTLSHRFVMPFYRSEEIPEFLHPLWQTKIPPGMETLIDSKIVYSTFGITVDESWLLESLPLFQKKTSTEMNEYWENMEATGLSYLAAREQIPYAALLCATNKVGKNGRRDWWQNHEKAGELLLEKLKNIFP